jgi:hypothetical protein
MILCKSDEQVRHILRSYRSRHNLLELWDPVEANEQSQEVVEVMERLVMLVRDHEAVMQVLEAMVDSCPLL